MKIPDEMRVDTNMIVPFKKRFNFQGIEYDAVAQDQDGTLIFLDTEAYNTDADPRIQKVEIKVDGGLK